MGNMCNIQSTYHACERMANVPFLKTDVQVTMSAPAAILSSPQPPTVAHGAVRQNASASTAHLRNCRQVLKCRLHRRHSCRSSQSDVAHQPCQQHRHRLIIWTVGEELLGHRGQAFQKLGVGSFLQQVTGSMGIGSV